MCLSSSTSVIGRGGEQITRIQLESGCKIQIAPGEFSAPFELNGLTTYLTRACFCRRRGSDGAAVFSDGDSGEHRVS